MARIYVSSTLNDLREQRKEVALALRRLGHDDVAMEYYVAEDKRPLDRCLNDVASCDVYIGVFAWRYGFIPSENNPEGRSITELEYMRARDQGLPCLIFLLSEDAPWPRSKCDKGAASDRIESLHQQLAEHHVVSHFENTDDLTRKVNEAVIKWEKKSGLVGHHQLTDWEAYRRAVHHRHQWVPLQVIAGASKQRGIAKIPLIEVFEPQLAAPGATPTDVPDEVRKYQDAIYGAGSKDPNETALEHQEPIPPEAAIEPNAEEPLFFSNSEIMLEMLGRESTQVILGGPGSGKSTILHYAMLCMCGGGPASVSPPTHLRDSVLPFLIELRNYVLQKESDFVAYIVNNSRDFYDADVDAESLVRVLRREGQARALVFFDGLDEVFDPDERRRVINQFATFAHRYPKAHIVVTSRIAGYDRTALGLAGFEHYTLLPLTIGQIRQFTDQWYKHYTLEGTRRTARGLVQRIIENPRLLDLAGNPLLLTMMAVIYKDRDLPNERWRLYERCAETLLEDWDLGKGIEDEDFKLDVYIRTAQKSEILQQVSTYMLEHGQKERELNAIAYAPLLDIVAGYLETKYNRSRGAAEAVSVDILRHLMERTYVLAGIGERVFGFVHRTFMEYFAACRCQAQFNARKSDFAWLTRDVFGAHWQESEWEEVLLLLIAMLHDQGTPIREVVEYIQKECEVEGLVTITLLKRAALSPGMVEHRTEGPHNVAFAARCLGEAGDVQDPSHGQTLLAELARAIAEYAPQTRKKETRKFVEMALKAFAVLAPQVATPATVDETIDRLNQAGNAPARITAWQMGFALLSRNDRLNYALDALNDKVEAVRRGAIAALEREWPGREDIGAALTRVVRNDHHTRVRHAALVAMQRSWRYEPSILDAIASRVDEETAYTYVIRLIEYLSEIWRGNSKAFRLVLQLAAPKPRAGPNYDDLLVREAAVQALAKGWSRDPLAFTHLQDWAASEIEPEIRAAALQGIAEGWRGDARALAYIQDRATRDPESAIRETALQCIAKGWRGDPRGFAFLKDFATSVPEPENRVTVLQAIAKGQRGGARALAFLMEQAVSEPDINTRWAVLKAIVTSWSDDIQSLVTLKELTIKASEPEMRIVGIQAFTSLVRHFQGMGSLFFSDGRFHSQDLNTAWAALRELVLHDSNITVRESALTSITMLYKFSLNRESWEVGFAQDVMRNMLTLIRDRAISDPDALVRLRGMKSLAWLFRLNSDAKDLNFLRVQAWENPEADKRSDALWTIAEGCRGDKKALAFLQYCAINDPDAQTRLVCLKIIRGYYGDTAKALAMLKDRAINDPDAENRSATREMIKELGFGARRPYWPDYSEGFWLNR